MTLSLLVWAWAWPTSSEACSCDPGSPDLLTNLREARKEASTIYYGRVVSIDEALVASVEVLEVFKGNLAVGTKLSVSYEHPCAYPFDSGETALIYADEDPSQVFLCTRTRRASKDDVELEWLRTGKPPAVPIALQRETVTCQSCSLETVTTSLVGPPPGASSNSPLPSQQALEALREVRPFWTASSLRLDDKGRRTAVGLSADLRAFELIQTPYRATRDACQQRVVRRWCEKLESSPEESSGAPALRCLNPGPEEEVCNETQSRAANWGSLEKIRAAKCMWFSPVSPYCELTKSPQPLPAGARKSPVLRCSPGFDTSTSFCNVQDAP